MKNIDLNALDIVSGGMNIKSLHAHLTDGDASHTTGPGFAPLSGHNPGGLDGGFPTSGTPAAGSLGISHASPGLDDLNSAPIVSAPQAQQQEHSFSNDLQAISSIVNAFAGIIGAFSGHGSSSSAAPSSPQGRQTTREPTGDTQNDQPDPQADLTGGLGNDTGADAAPTGGVVAENDGTGNHTNFHETNDGFVRG